jgi:hypothetical protein
MMTHAPVLVDRPLFLAEICLWRTCRCRPCRRAERRLHGRRTNDALTSAYASGDHATVHAQLEQFAQQAWE